MYVQSNIWIFIFDTDQAQIYSAAKIQCPIFVWSETCDNKIMDVRAQN